jgi:hypothetical protein
VTETTFQKQLKQLAQSHRKKEKLESAKAKHGDNVKLQTTNTMAEVLHQFASEVLQCDDHLLQDETPEGSIGIVISYRKRTNSVRPSFRVSVTCQPDTVEVNVSDGRWKQVSGVLGAWADWTDQQKVYSGAPDSSTIRKSLESAFLTWYERAMKVPDETLDTCADSRI